MLLYLQLQPLQLLRNPRTPLNLTRNITLLLTFSFIHNLGLEPFILLFQLLYHLRIPLNMILCIKRIPIDLGLYVLRSVCIDQGVVGVLKAVHSWGDVCDHDCSAVASEGVFEKSGEFAVSVGYVEVFS